MSLFCLSTSIGQSIKLESKKDTLTDDGFFINYPNYKRKVYNLFKIGKIVQIHPGESREKFVARITEGKSSALHPCLELADWKFPGGRAFVSFQKFTFHKVFRQGQIDQQESIVGLLFVPIDHHHNYLIVKINEIMTSGGAIDVKAVFFTNVDKNRDDKELAIMVTETFSKHGTVFETYFYQNHLCHNKLMCLGNLSEHCDYSMVKKGDTWDYMYKEEALPTKYVDCTINTLEKVQSTLRCSGL